MTSLIMNNVRKGYIKKCVIFDASASFHDFGLHLLRGANGSGKTTLLEILAGLTPPTSGRVVLDGEDVSKHQRSAARRIAYAPARPGFLDGLTVNEAIRLYLSLRGHDPGRDVFSRSDPFVLCGHAGCRFADLSLGLQKRVVLHMVFSIPVDILLLDEPTIGLDVTSTAALAALIRMRSHEGIVIFTCHEPSVLGELSLTAHDLKATSHGSVLERTS